MRIGVVGPNLPDRFANNIIDSLQHMGHDAFSLGSAHPRPHSQLGTLVVDTLRKATPIELAIQKRVVRRARELEAELVITVEGHLLPETVNGFKQLGCRTAFWFPDAISNLGRLLMFVAPYDALFFKEPLLVERARRLLDARIEHLPQACNPRWHTPPQDTEREESIIFAGTLYPWRARLLERVIAAGLPLKIYGAPLPRWLHSPVLEAHHQRRMIFRSEKARLFRSAAVVLNTMHPGEINGLNLRVFEAAGCGAALLTEHRPELETSFEVGAEVAAYSSFEELCERAHILLKDPVEGRRLGDAAAHRAHRDHTYSVRLERLLEVVY